MITFIIWDVSPVFVDLGFLQIRWYSLFFGLGFLLSYLILARRFDKLDLSRKDLDTLTFYVLIATVVGARLAHCIFYDWSYYSEHLLEIFLPVRFDPNFEFIGYQGLASHGGIFGVGLAIVIFSKKFKVNTWWLLDQLAVVGALAGACIRFGNLMNSEIIGKPATVPWAFVFTRVDQIPRHPGQLYEALSYLAIFVLLLVVQGKNRRPFGFLFGLFFVLLFTTRFIIEFVKADQSAFEAGMVLNMGQILSIPFIILGLTIMIIVAKGKSDFNPARSK